LLVQRNFPDQILNAVDPRLYEECKGSTVETEMHGCLLSLVQCPRICRYGREALYPMLHAGEAGGARAARPCECPAREAALGSCGRRRRAYGARWPVQVCARAAREAAQVLRVAAAALMPIAGQILYIARASIAEVLPPACSFLFRLRYPRRPVMLFQPIISRTPSSSHLPFAAGFCSIPQFADWGFL